MVSPSDRQVDMPIDGGFVGMVDREHFDEWLRERAAAVGAERAHRHLRADRRATDDGLTVVTYRDEAGAGPCGRCARAVIGADGARSAVARQAVPGADEGSFVFAYHEIVRAPQARRRRLRWRRAATSIYQGELSPDFYGWVFPHGDTISVGTGSARQGLLAARRRRRSCARRRAWTRQETLRREGAPIPLQPLQRWDNGRDVVLAGDAAGVVAPASGEGIYYAMAGGRLAAEAVEAFLATGDARALADAAQALHEGARPGVLGARHHAALLVRQRQAARALRQHLPRPRRAAADLARPT